MKALKLTDDLILKESLRFTNRESNTMEIRLLIKIKYGSEITEELEEATKEFSVVIEERDNPQSWEYFKDITIAGLMGYIAENYTSTNTEEDSEDTLIAKPFNDVLFGSINMYPDIEIIDI